MNNTFDIKRFGNYALMNYWYHKRQYLGLIVGIAVMLLLQLCEFKFQSYATTWESNIPPIDKVIDSFRHSFFISGFLFTILYIKVSMQGINGHALSMQDILIPVSTFERYIFAIINSTVAATIVYIIIFQIMSSFIESLYLFSDNGYLFKGFLGYNKAIGPNSEFTEACHISLKDVICSSFDSSGPQNITINIMLLTYTCFISAFMWGEITFRHQGALVLTILSHLAIAGAVVTLFAFTNHKTPYSTCTLFVRYTPYESIENNAMYILSALYILPITYQWVIWKKLKNISLTK